MTNQHRRDKESSAGSHREEQELPEHSVGTGYREVSTALAREAKRWHVGAGAFSCENLEIENQAG